MDICRIDSVHDVIRDLMTPTEEGRFNSMIIQVATGDRKAGFIIHLDMMKDVRITLYMSTRLGWR